jgi:sugar-specific transcriptional regulator TrmB
MSRKRIVSTLTSLGLSREEIRIYVFLATEGPRESQTVAKTLKITQLKAAKCLEILKNKGLVMIINNVVPSQLYAIPFENALDLLVETNLKQAQNTEQNRSSIIKDLDSALRNHPSK